MDGWIDGWMDKELDTWMGDRFGKMDGAWMNRNMIFRWIVE